MSFLSRLLRFLKRIFDFFAGRGKVALLFDQLKNNPADEALNQKVKDLFVERPVDVVIEIMRRVRSYDINRNKEFKNVYNNPQGVLRQTWQNTIHRETVQPLQYYTPNSKDALAIIIPTAEKNGLMVRAVGTGHSFSDVSNATDVLVDMRNLNNVLPLEQGTFKSGLPVLFNCEAGMLVQKLNAELDKQNLALPTMAAFDQETIYGAIATSTHGTGIRVPGMPAMVRSLDLLAAGGKWYRVEPADGITDKALFAAKYPGKEIELVQDDDKFHSVVVGFGLMGIVYSIVIEPRPLFYLMQRLWVTTWDKVKPKLIDRSFFAEIDPQGKKEEEDPATGELPPTRAQLFVNPYLYKNFITQVDARTCVVQVQTEITRKEYEDLQKEEKKEPHVNKLVSLIRLLKSNGEQGIHESTIAEEDDNSIIEEIGVDVLLMLFNDFPSLTPLLVEVSMLALLSGSGKFGKGYVVMNQGKLAVKNSGYSVEPGFAVNETNNFVKGAEEIIRVAELSQQSYSYLTSPMCMRFVKASDDYLSPEYKTDTCMIDVPMMLGTIGDNQMYDRLQLDTLPFGARPHWGKICNMVNGRELLEKMYPKFDEFVEAIRFFNPNGTFNSSFSYRTGISEIVYKRD